MFHERFEYKEGDYWHGPLNHMSPFQAESFLHLVGEEEVRESRSLGETQSRGEYLLLTLKMKGAT